MLQLHLILAMPYCSSRVAQRRGAVEKSLRGANEEEEGVVQKGYQLNHILEELFVWLEECCHGKASNHHVR